MLFFSTLVEKLTLQLKAYVTVHDHSQSTFFKALCTFVVIAFKIRTTILIMDKFMKRSRLLFKATMPVPSGLLSKSIRMQTLSITVEKPMTTAVEISIGEGTTAQVLSGLAQAGRRVMVAKEMFKCSEPSEPLLVYDRYLKLAVHCNGHIFAHSP